MKYKLNKRHYLNDRLYNAGEIVDWDGPPSLTMVPVDEPAKRAKEAYDKDRAQRPVGRRNGVGWTPGLQAHQWNMLTRPDPELPREDGLPADPMANINITGERRRSPGRPRKHPVAST